MAATEWQQKVEEVRTLIHEYHSLDTQCMAALSGPITDYQKVSDQRRAARTRARELMAKLPDGEREELEKTFSPWHAYVARTEHEWADVAIADETPAVPPVKRKRAPREPGKLNGKAPARKRSHFDQLVRTHLEEARAIFVRIKKASAEKPLNRNQVFPRKLQQQLSLRLANAGIVQVDTTAPKADNRYYWFDETKVNKEALGQLMEMSHGKDD